MAVLSDFILVKLNGQKEAKETAEKYAVGLYPTFAVVSAEGTLESWVGYKKQMFLTRAEAALTDLTTIEEKLVRYQADPSPRDAALLGRYHFARNEYATSIEYYEAAGKLDKDPEATYLMPIFENAYYGYRDEAIEFDEVRTRADDLFASNAITDSDAILAARMILVASRHADATEAAVPFLKKAVARAQSSNDEKVKGDLKLVLPDYAMMVLNDKDKAVEYKRAAMKEGWQEDAGGLNAFAWWCFENKVNLKEAQALAEKGVELAEPGGEKAQILDTAAEICNARENCEQALALIQQAIREDPDHKHYKTQEKRFQELLAAKKGIR